MTRAQRLAGVAVLLLGVACGRLGDPVRSSASRAPQPPQTEAPAGGVQTPAGPDDQDSEEKKR